MYYCNNCNSEFKDLELKEVKAEDYYGVSGQFMSSHTMTIAECPCCGSDDYEEMVMCPMCEEYFKEEDLIDTEGLPNGGVGNICEDCLKNLS